MFADLAVLVVTWKYMRPIATPQALPTDIPRANGNMLGRMSTVVVKDGASLSRYRICISFVILILIIV